MSNSETPISINEHLSAMLDDEVGAFEQRRIFDELKTDQALNQKLSSYALIGEVMRMGEAEKPLLSLDNSFLEGIHNKISDEDEFDQVIIENVIQPDQAPQNTTTESSSWLRPTGGFAIAASLGALAFMGFQNMDLLNSPATNPNNIVDNAAPTAIVQTTVSDQSLANSDNMDTLKSDQYIDADAETRSLLKRYVDSHMQYATSSTFVPSVRVIAYTDNQ